MKTKDGAMWKIGYKVEKYRGEISPCRTIREWEEWRKTHAPEEVIELEKNCLLNGGITELWGIFIGSSVNHFDNSNTEIGVGDSSDAAAATQTDLQASTNKAYLTMDASYPIVSSQSVIFMAVAGTSVANFAWNEWVIKQTTSGVCLNRKVASLGTKTSSYSWIITATITLA